MVVTQIETVLKWVVVLEEAITIMVVLQWADRIAEAMTIDHQGLVEITSTNLHQELWEILTPVTITILHQEVITDWVNTTLLHQHTILQLQILQTTIEEVTQVDNMEVIPLTIEAGTSIILPLRIERETTMTKRETESTWIREMIRMQEATTTMHQLEAALTSRERAEAPTTVT